MLLLDLAMVKGAATLVLVLVSYLIDEGHSQGCVNGLMSAERVRQLGRVAGNRKDDRKEQQRIIPDISFTCSGTVTRWIVAGNERNDDNLPQIQIWRETFNGSGIYSKEQAAFLPMRDESPSDIYEFNATMDVQPGDILGLFEPDDSWLRLYYTNKYGPVNYYMETDNAVTPPTGDFDISGADGTTNDMPLITLEFSPTDGSSASDCVRNFASMDDIVIALQRSIRDERRQQRLIPGINFTCHGFITKWIFAAKWRDIDNLPELQTWNSSDGTTYTKQGVTTVSFEGGSAEMTYYEYRPNPPHEFNNGDVLGVFIPDRTRLQMFFERVDSGFLNYVHRNVNSIPPEGDFVTTTADNTANAAPLIAVEVSIPPLPYSTNSVLPSPSATTSHIKQWTISLPLGSELTAAVSGSMDSTSTPAPERTDESSSSSSNSYQLSAAFVTPTPVSELTDKSNSSSESSDHLSASVDTPTPVPEPTDENSSSSGSSGQLTVGVFSGVAVGAVIVVILGVVFIVVIFGNFLRKRRPKEYTLSTSVVQENPAYGTAISTRPGLEENPAYGTAVNTGAGLEENPAYGAAISTGPVLEENPAYGAAVSTGPGLEMNPAYNAFEMTDCDDGDHRDQADLGEYDMIDNRQYRMPRSEMPEDLVYSYILIRTPTGLYHHQTGPVTELQLQ